MTDVTFVQTADPVFYEPMLRQTSRTVRQYCLENGFSYESYIGIKRGVVPWQAAYNRVYILTELINRGVDGWVFYMDADAFIGDLDFDLRDYLRDKHHLAGIFLGYVDSELPYAINSGGFALNLSHAMGRRLAADYRAAVDSILEGAYGNAAIWGRDIPEDQWLLHRLLADYCGERGLTDSFRFERSGESYVNSGPFIRQQLRSISPNFRDRLAAIETDVDRILSGRDMAWANAGAGFFFPASHPRIKADNGVKADGQIHSRGGVGTLSYGPYIPLCAGNYLARIIGRVAAASTRRSWPNLWIDVTSEEGATSWARSTEAVDAPRRGVIAEQRFTLTRDVVQAEVKLGVDRPHDIRIEAVQILSMDDWVREN